MKKVSIILILLLALAGAFYLFRQNDFNLVKVNLSNREGNPVTTNTVSPFYKEHVFQWSSSGFYSGDALKKAVKSGDTLIANAKPIAQPEWEYIDESPNEYNAYHETWKIQGDRYEFKTSPIADSVPYYTVHKNGQKLFEHEVDYGAEGPIVQKAIINNQPAFSFRTACPGDDYASCEYNIFYQDKYLSNEYGAKSPHFIFTHDNKIGFIVKTEQGYAIYFNGKVISNNYDQIHYQNCCSVFELLPTVYDNGVLVFYAKKAGQDYVTEIKL